jgi:hypothetical protein
MGSDPEITPTNTQCNSGQPSGKVVAKYDVGTDLLFAGMINRRVSATATALWGAAGGGVGMGPFALQAGRLASCDIPPADPDNPPTQDCKFYFNDNASFIGQSSWAPLNLNLWDVPRDFNPCPNTGGANDMRSWIAGSAPALSINYPDATYVCRKPGAQTSTFTGSCQEDLEALDCNMPPHSGTEGEMMTFPVNSPCPGALVDPEFGPLPHGQVDGPGAFVCPPGDPMKYDIVGFVTLQLVSLHRGNNKNAFKAACPEFVGGAYPDPSDANSYCMIARWVGYSTSGIIGDGGGFNFGTFAVGLGG